MGQHATAALSPGNTQYQPYRKLGGPQGRSGRMRKISPQPKFDPQTIRAVESHYTDCTIPAHKLLPTINDNVRYDKTSCASLLYINVTHRLKSVCKEKLNVKNTRRKFQLGIYNHNYQQTAGSKKSVGNTIMKYAVAVTII